MFDPKIDRTRMADACCDAVNRGVAVWKGKVYVGAFDGRLIALDAATGEAIWSVQTFDPAKRYSITGSPRVMKGLVVIGNGGAELGVRGYVTAYDAETGAKKWRFYTVPNAEGTPDHEVSDAAMASVRPGWSETGGWKSFGGGGTVWDAIVYDPDLDLLYLGVGNGSPWDYELRSDSKGDNLFLSSIVAVRPSTGEYVWHYQQVPGESWDYTATQPIILATLNLNGKPRKVLMQAPKNGYFFVLDRATGKPISITPLSDKINWATGYDMATGRPNIVPEALFGKTGKPFAQSPGPSGLHNWQPMAFNPKTGLVYIPANEVPFAYAPPEFGYEKKWQPKGQNIGIAIGWMPNDKMVIREAIKSWTGSLIAFDPVQRKIAWTVPYPTPFNSGVLATAGNLVFQGTTTGEFHAYAADSGKLLRSLAVQSSPLAAPSTFSWKGVQYVALSTGKGGSYPISAGKIQGPYLATPGIARLILLKLDGKGQLPPPPARPPLQFNRLAAIGTPQQILEGARQFARICAGCHGGNAMSNTDVPDLRVSPTIADAMTFKAIVHDGAMKAGGMAAFSSVLTPEQVESIRAYIIDQTNWDSKNWPSNFAREGQ
jgi:quinohemoprotein ethanol dehydrogenase